MVVAFLGQDSLQAQEDSATKTYAKECSNVQKVALEYLRERHWTINASGLCAQCFRGAAQTLFGDNRKRIHASRSSIEELTTKDLGFLKSRFPDTFVFSGLNASSWLSLQDIGAGGCAVKLRFEYGWYGTELRLGFPIDGDTMSAYSKLVLEKQYLEGIGKKLQ